MSAKIFGGFGSWLANLVGMRKKVPRGSKAVRARRRKQLTRLLMVGAHAIGKRGVWVLQRASAVLRTLEEAEEATCGSDVDRQRCSLGRAYHDLADRLLTQAVRNGAASVQQAALRNLHTAASYLK